MVNNHTPQEIGEFISEQLPGCKFVGISGDGEAFVRFENDDIPLQKAQIAVLRKHFADLTSISTVVEPSVEQVKKMVDELNGILDGPENTGQGPDLLDISEF